MTRLKALELFGFKSFADRTRFEFPEGLTVVVGPNGSGKSNVVDAIKWVLGEQSMRSLRGRDATDVIFAGSVSRKPLNAAETSLIFDNSARALPVEQDEVQITRRVYRSGESEYLVNGEISRLRDIRELFSGTGAATEAYSVIEQGRVDALLVASGRDRRAVFEEAAGITKFRARRTESLRRLERTEQNRQRLADIVGEVSSRLDTVRHQAARARRWRLMTDRLRTLRLAAAAEDLAEVDASVAAVDAALTALRRDFVAAETEATLAAGRTAELERVEHDLAPRLADAQDRVTSDKQRAAAAEATLALLRQRRTEIEGDVARHEAGVREAAQRLRDAVGAVEDARRQAETIQAELSRIHAELASHEQSAAGSHQHVADLRSRLAEQSARGVDLERRRLRLEADADRAATGVDEARRRIDACREKIDAARRQQALLAESIATREGNVAALAARLAATDSEMESLEAEQRERAHALEHAWRDLAGWQAKLEACLERKGMLEELVGRHEGLSDAAKRLVGPEAGQSAVPGLQGVLGDLIDAPVGWAHLVDLALRDRAQSLVVDSLDDLVRWFSHWADSAEAQATLVAGGRVSFMAAEQADETATDAFDASGHPGVVGRLDKLVETEAASERHRLIARRLLGKVWVVERLDHAQALARVAPAGVLVVTRGGQCLSTDGVFEIGTPAAASGIVSRRSELRAVTTRHEELTRTVAATAESINGLQAELAGLQQSIRRLHARRQQEAENIASSRAEFERLTRDRSAGSQSLAAAEAAAVEAEREAVALSQAREAADTALAQHLAELDDTRRETAATQSTLDSLDRDRGEVIDAINRLRIERAASQERLARGHDAVSARRGDLEARRADLEAARDRRGVAEQRLDALDSELLAAQSAFAEAMTAAERLGNELAELCGIRDALVADKTSATTTAEANRAAAARFGEAIHTQELDAGEARHRRARIIERIRDEYDLDIEAETRAQAERRAAAGPEAPADADPIPATRPELDAEIEELRRKLGSMSTVNLEALAEAEALTERLATLEAQLADVTNAKQSIEQLISRIDDESRRLLGETIETVRGHFRELFERVFGGGQADIVLDPEMDLLDTTVEIVARPPGKEPRSISLLSGGEKTMTCVALLLAIFRSRPSPFCVLDEVDAALDEANVDRFVGVLRDFLSSTQFIIVTHSKKTMAAANTLYGVTMEESGVSKRVSVRFESTAAAASRPSAKAA
jgi:chromosome segregation protein